MAAEDSGSRTPGGRLKSAGEKMTRISTLSIIGQCSLSELVKTDCSSDLAGSEKHTSSKERNAEGKHINQSCVNLIPLILLRAAQEILSLLTLKLVISKLADIASKRNVSHVPFRDSKLSALLLPSRTAHADWNLTGRAFSNPRSRATPSFPSSALFHHHPSTKPNLSRPSLSHKDSSVSFFTLKRRKWSIHKH